MSGSSRRGPTLATSLAVLGEFADIRSVRSCLVFLVLAACELTPAPKPAPPEPTPEVAPPAPAPKPVVADAGVPDALVFSDACITLGSHVADLKVAAAPPAERPALEQQRVAIVRNVAESCTLESWNDAFRNCLIATKKQAELAVCEKKFRPAPAQPPVPKNPDMIEAPKAKRAEPQTEGPKATPKTSKAGDAKAASPKPGEPKAAKPTTPKPATPKAGVGSTAPKQP
jgi:hypothetical protein